MNQDQVNSLVRSGLKVVGAIALGVGAKNLAAVVDIPGGVEAVCGLASTIVGLWLSHNHHADEGKDTKNAS